MINKLYGDGIHDDYPAIQEMLDSPDSLVYLPEPEKNYVISKTLLIGSNKELRLDRYTRVVLADNANCMMIENKNQNAGDVNITISGGIWDMNHKKQWQNPYHFPNPITGLTWYEECEKAGYTRDKKQFSPFYSGHCFRFNNIEHFTFKNITIVNPVVYGLQMAYTTHFLIENIDFDYTEGSPKLWNMDGIHIEGGCKHGLVRNLHGACHDDTVAITSDDCLYGEISDITVDGIYADGCHSAVRLLSADLPVKNIHITNIYGTYYVYCVTLSNYYYFEGKKGHYDHITIDNIYASFCEGTVDVAGNYCALIPIDREVEVGDLLITNVYRDETRCNQPTFCLNAGSIIHKLTIKNCTQNNLTGNNMNFFDNYGDIDKLLIKNIDCGKDKKILNNGTILLDE